MRKVKTILVLVGIPGSGKSTWSTKKVENDSDWIRINRDSYRLMLKNQTVCEFKIEDLITKLSYSAVEMALSNGYNVILDNTHCQAKYLKQIVDRFQTMANIEFQLFDISVEKAIERDAARPNPVGPEVIKRMDKDLKNALEVFPLQKVFQKSVKTEYLNSDNLEKVVIFDIDGTIAHMNGKRGPFDWNKVDRDDLDPIVSDIFKRYIKDGIKVFLVSGRDEESRLLTKEWLSFYGLDGYQELYMRPKGDYRKDTVVKKEIYQNHFAGKYWVEVVYDDRSVVVDMWRSLGVKCFQVEPGNF